MPTPYRSPAREVEQLAVDGVAVDGVAVECEVASLLAVAEALGVHAGACLSVMSSLVGHEHDPSLTLADLRTMLESTLDALGICPDRSGVGSESVVRVPAAGRESRPAIEAAEGDARDDKRA